MSTPTPESPAGTEVPFSAIVEAMGRRTLSDPTTAPARALLATVVVVGPPARLDEAAAALKALADAGTVRVILISAGSNPAPPARVTGNTVSLSDLHSPYINNAVAALRLSSLPTMVWWRGGTEETLPGLADLADRVVLDAEEPERCWAQAVTLFDDTAFSDMRWARLTQWRALMCHFFDIPEVRAAAHQFTRLEVCGSDHRLASLFAAWLQSSIELDKNFRVEFRDGEPGVPLQEIKLGDERQELELRLAGGRTCLESAVAVSGQRSAAHVVSLTDQSLRGVLYEELRIRARDMAFERAVAALVRGQQ
jgi:glucose-6-phosphate dehydrogenase assembly protein OpcA